MLKNATMMGFIGISDGKQARAFYSDILGLPVISEDSFAIVFDANGILLRGQKVEKVTPTLYTAAGWLTADIEVTVQALAAAGVETLRYGFMEQDVYEIWTSPGGAKVAWFLDPDGNSLSVTQAT